MNAAPVPMAIRVNILGLAFLIEATARTKNGHPPHQTTGVASINWTHKEIVAARPCGHEGNSASKDTNISDIASTKTGSVRTPDIQSRRFMSMYSWSGRSSRVI